MNLKSSSNSLWDCPFLQLLLVLLLSLSQGGNVLRVLAVKQSITELAIDSLSQAQVRCLETLIDQHPKSVVVHLLDVGG